MKRRFLCIVPLLALGLVGCATYSMEGVRAAFAAGDYDTALARLDARKELSLPYLFERGLVAHYAGKFDESNRAFDVAEYLSEELYTKSLSREVAALLTSDTQRPYAGTRYERLLVHYYRALNYVYLGLPDDALVEIRRAGRLLEHYADEDPSYTFAGAAFLAYLSGLLYEWAGEWNDAYIAYRWAESGYAAYAKAFGVPPPKEIGEALVRLARRLGFEEEAGRYVTRYGEPKPVPDGWGELVLIYESGFAPYKVEENLLLPIFKTDRFEKKEEIWTYAGRLVKRRHVAYDKTTLEYLLRVALPAYVSNRPRFRGIRIATDDQTACGALAEDLERVIQYTFESEASAILLRATARALLKYLAFRRAKKEGAVAGWVVNALGVATERADTRSWQTLPNLIFVVRMALPPGSHNLRLSFLDEEGRGARTETLRGVVIEPGRMTILNYRTFD